MPVVRSRGRVDAPVARAFAFFDDPTNLSRLVPPPASIQLMRVEPDPPRAGSIIEFRYGLGPIRRTWTTRLVERVANQWIVDETLSGPLRRFHFTHRFTAAEGGGTWIEDEVDFHLGPGGPIGAVLDFGVGLGLRATFAWRRRRQRSLLAR